MRDFTPEEKKLIINTPITKECFEFDHRMPIPYSYLGDESSTDLESMYNHLAFVCEHLRETYNETGDEDYFTELVRLLPASYKVVKL